MTELIYWKPIPEFEDRYEVSSSGLVRSIARIEKTSAGYIRRKKSSLVKPQVSKHGYAMYHLHGEAGRKVLYGHRAVIIAFHGGIAKGMEINHIDGNKLNNSLSNLEVCSRSYNCHHTHKLLGKGNGSDCPSSKLDEAAIISILSEVKSGTKQSELAKKYRVSPMTISLVCNGKTWRHVTDRVNWLAEMPSCEP